MKELKRILLIEDSANDAELILAALSENHLANEVVVVRDGEEALDYHDFVDSIKGVGLFWAVINQPPVGALPPAPHPQQESN